MGELCVVTIDGRLFHVDHEGGNTGTLQVYVQTDLERREDVGVIHLEPLRYEPKPDVGLALLMAIFSDWSHGRVTDPPSMVYRVIVRRSAHRVEEIAVCRKSKNAHALAALGWLDRTADDYDVEPRDAFEWAKSKHREASDPEQRRPPPTNVSRQRSSLDLTTTPPGYVLRANDGAEMARFSFDDHKVPEPVSPGAK